jgi:hypothetical protein
MRRGNKMGRSPSMPTGLVGMFDGVVEDPIAEEEDAHSTMSDESAHSAKPACHNARLWAETRMIGPRACTAPHKSRQGFPWYQGGASFQICQSTTNGQCSKRIRLLPPSVASRVINTTQECLVEPAVDCKDFARSVV